jgi:sialate O-acetylesterase
MQTRLLTRLLIGASLLVSLAQATPVPSGLFADHAVLQQKKPIPVWGQATPGETVTVRFAGQSRTAKTDATGRWQVTLDPLPASAEGRDLTITGADGIPVVARDVLVGEVWLGSGQSNMVVAVKNANRAAEEISAANLPRIRMFSEESSPADSPQSQTHGTWEVCSPKTVSGFSATLYFFGRELHRELNVPVGLIRSAVGATPIESWIAADVQAKIPELKAGIDEDVKAEAKYDRAGKIARYEQALAAWKEAAAKAKIAGQPIPERPADTVSVRDRRGSASGGSLFNAKIAPLIPYALRGIVWYQGENNSNNEPSARRYALQLPLLVTDWRARWGEELPFAWVQLPNYESTRTGWMLIREAQLKTLRLPHTGMATTLDIGETDQIHPKNKQDVGRRLSFWALGEVYGRKVPATSGPLPASIERRGSDYVIRFTHTEGGLIAKDGPLTGFVLAGDDHQWKPASARIEGDTVIVSSPEVKAPQAVRYAWAPNPPCNLFNGAGLPASQFRSDDK